MDGAMKRRNVAILIFNDVEILDFTGPYEVFSVADELHEHLLFNVYTVAERNDAVQAKNRLSINPSYTIDECPKPDILVIPGGDGTRSLLENMVILTWIRQTERAAEMILSVCTGSLLLAKAGILDGLKATTHHTALELLSKLAPQTEILSNIPYVDNGSVTTSAGVSTGIDMCLFVVGKIFGEEASRRTAHNMEYTPVHPPSSTKS
jgi:transcriptional regulator GlxA family with amidase domain